VEFTEEQLRKAIEYAQGIFIKPGKTFADDVIKKLNEPEFDPDPEQVVYFQGYGYFKAGHKPPSNGRFQTLDECGPNVRAMQEAFEKIKKIAQIDSPIYKIVSKILKHRIPE